MFSLGSELRFLFGKLGPLDAFSSRSAFDPPSKSEVSKAALNPRLFGDSTISLYRLLGIRALLPLPITSVLDRESCEDISRKIISSSC